MSISKPLRAPRATTRASRLAFRDDIEGLRGLAILLVVLYHARVPGFPGGFIGVDVFFVISGFLITGLLLEELRASGRIDFVAFYGARARRLLPALAVTLAVTLLASVFLLSPLEQVHVGRSGIAAALYVSNFFFMNKGIGYFDARVEDNPLLHTWSLGVEEQFYAVWPLLILAAVRYARSERGLYIILGVVAAASFMLCFWLAATHPAYGFYASPPRAWQFATGAFVWMLLRDDRRTPPAFTALLGVAAIIAAAIVITRQTAYPGAAALLPTIGTALVIWGATEKSFAGRILTTAPARYLGRVSYSWYLWHWPILVFAVRLLPDISLPGRLACAVFALLLSHVTHTFIENRFRYGARWVGRRWSSIKLGGAATALGMAAAVLLLVHASALLRTDEQKAFAAASADRPRHSGCISGVFATGLKECVYGNRSSGTTIVLYGDSHAAQWLPALEWIAQQHGWRLVTFLRGACPAPYIEVVGQAEQRMIECMRWRHDVVARVRQLKPHAVIVTSYQAAYLNSRIVPGPERESAWRNAYAELFSDLNTIATHTILLADTPMPGENVPQCLSRRDANWLFRNTSCEVSRGRAFVSELQLAQSRAAASKAIHQVDLTAHFCNDERCPSVIDGMVVYRDDNHITAAFARSMADRLAKEIVPVIAR